MWEEGLPPYYLSGKRCSVPIGEANLGWVRLMSGKPGLGERRTGGTLRRLRTRRACGWARAVFAFQGIDNRYD